MCDLGGGSGGIASLALRKLKYTWELETVSPNNAIIWLASLAEKIIDMGGGCG